MVWKKGQVRHHSLASAEEYMYGTTSKAKYTDREKERYPTQSYDKTPYTNRKKKLATQKRHQNLDFTTIADRL